MSNLLDRFKNVIEESDSSAKNDNVSRESSGPMNNVVNGVMTKFGDVSPAHSNTGIERGEAMDFPPEEPKPVPVPPTPFEPKPIPAPPTSFEPSPEPKPTPTIPPVKPIPAVSPVKKISQSTEKAPRKYVLTFEDVAIPKLRGEDFQRSSIMRELFIKVMGSFGLASINLSYFGDCMVDLGFDGFERVAFGDHVFLVKDEDPSLGNIVKFLENMHSEINSTGVMRRSLVKMVDVDGSTAYSLAVTMKDLKEIVKIYPDYTFEIEDIDAPLASLTLVIRP